MKIQLSKMKYIMIWHSKTIKKSIFRKSHYWYLRLPFGIIIHYAKLPF